MRTIIVIFSIFITLAYLGCRASLVIPSESLLNTQNNTHNLYPETRKAAIANLLIGLNSDNYGLRTSSAYMLGEIKAVEAVIPLINMLRTEKNEDGKIAAAHALYKINDSRGVLAVKQAIRFDNTQNLYPETRKAVIANLLIGLNSDNYGLRTSSAYMLGEIKAVEAVIPLINMLRTEKNEDGKIAAAHALYKINDSRGVLAVKQAIRFDTTIGFGIQNKSNVKITILNDIGEELAVVLNEEREPGYHQVEFSAANLPSGVYFYRIKAGDFIQTKKMILLR